MPNLHPFYLNLPHPIQNSSNLNCYSRVTTTIHCRLQWEEHSKTQQRFGSFLSSLFSRLLNVCAVPAAHSHGLTTQALVMKDIPFVTSSDSLTNNKKQHRDKSTNNFWLAPGLVMSCLFLTYLFISYQIWLRLHYMEFDNQKQFFKWMLTDRNNCSY